MVDQCRQVWEHDKGVTVAVGDNSVIQLVSIGATATNVAMALGKKRITQTNATHDNTKNITCILFSKDNYTKLFFTTPRVETESQIDTDLTSHSHSNTTDESSGPRNKSPAPSTPEHLHVLVSVVVPVVVLVSSGLVSVALKLRFHKVQYNRDTRRAAASSALRRSASLPALRYTKKEVKEDSASCKSLPADIYSTESTYSVIPDNVAAAQRPLPDFPHNYSDIPDAEHSAHLDQSHTYCDIPDDDDKGTNSFYAAGADLSLCIENTPYGISDELNRPVSTLRYHHPVARRQTAVYGTDIEARGHRISIYGKEANANRQQRRQAQGLGRTHYTLLSASLPVTLPNTHWPWKIPGEGTGDTPRRVEGTRNAPRRVSLPTVTLPNTYWPWEIPGQGTRNTPRRASLSTVTLPNTYWPWEIPGQGTRNTPRRASLPTVTLPNTYWPWEIPGQGTRNTPRRASLPTVTLPNTYWPWEIPGQGTHNTPRRASLPTVTLPNTYWPWEIPGQGTRNTPRRASLPTVTLPNTYWPWEIPGEGT
ncbi:hypothetical protein Bbelb_124550 [Branchiostoma belcheri]|nr:hypothetical protein Bbelb_124550 [Branchiostoma belcheri]